jgi:hypothetical protein
MREPVARRSRRGVIHAKPFAASHARVPVTPAAAVVAPIMHWAHMGQNLTAGLRGERYGSHPGERSCELGEDGEVGVRLDALDASHAGGSSCALIGCILG